ncbi:MAG: hypothetical protein ACLUNZ_06600 [Evtepia sp.]
MPSSSWPTGILDFAASARSHLADPNWANKAFAGQEADILPCISCMACFSKFDGEGASPAP